MLLEFEQVTKRYNGILALSGVSLKVRQGEVLGLIGPNGSGKTTIFNLISRLTHSDAGSIHLNGRPIRDLRPADMITHGVARVFQTPQLCSHLTVLDNVCVGSYSLEQSASRSYFQLKPPIRLIEAQAALSLVGVQGTGSSLPATLSFFEQRKVELARALMSKPRLVLLDEVTSGFTAAERETFEQTLRKVNGAGTTLFLIEHDLSLIRCLCNRVVVLDAGKKVSEGPPSLIEEDPAVRHIYVGAPGAAHQQAHS